MAKKKNFFLCVALVLGVTFVTAECDARILYPVAPDGGVQAASNALDSRDLRPMTHLPPAKDLTIARPFGVYWRDFNNTNPFAGPFLSATRFAGWRFMLSDGTNSSAVQLQYDEKKREWPEMGWAFYLVTAISNDPVRQTLRAAEHLPQAKKQDYELRYLDFFDLSFAAVWLHGKTNDIIIPVQNYRTWQDVRTYSELEIAAMLRREIEERMKAPRPKGSEILVD